ncbi:circadian clock protein KaiC [Megalodesulfovibrio gigas]|uniref:non-specific serine/threonine protein kinase n=1 Tax=Megalodesulfovibrio gigas (strain ATCC 19364 / DSM 1382 / NCIMB 9332 / VKM B-1759) TaxID=1121448 RepID=T2GC84_MEGG1|nr:circadian clock protein KaiC [Megalodesulfovibrio gigas]AGW14180.1 putative circadian clock protein KaiC [Megalodesulfovibrio gigas DSM 1382 = ATCC 19364]
MAIDPSPIAGETTLSKCLTGIQGLDEITGGGLPKGRPILVCGGPGCGKTLLGMEFLVRGAREFGEHGVFVTFEERPEELAQNVATFGWNLKELETKGKLVIEHIRVERSEIEETGEYDLEGLFIRLGAAVAAVGAKRIVLDTVESLFAALPNELILRAELRRLFGWCKDKGLTAIITGERGDKTLTRHGLEEYVSDCVVDLNIRVKDDIATRRLRIVKYRGSMHCTNEYPFLIGSEGFSVMPITSISLDYATSNERVLTGVERLDAMLDGRGYYQGSSILISGSAGTGKSSLAAALAKSTCSLGGKCLYFAFEEPVSQIIRNMDSIGMDLGKWMDAGLLRFHASRPTSHGMEMHLLTMYHLVREFKPQVVIIDPISNLSSVGNEDEVKSLLTRFVDFLKGRGVTTLFTDLTSGMSMGEYTEVAISSLMDTWILLRNIETNGERNRALFVLKSRGMEHSNQVRELILSSQGLDLADVYLGTEGVLMGSARATQEAREREDSLRRVQELKNQKRTLLAKRVSLESQIASIRQELVSMEAEMEAVEAAGKAQLEAVAMYRDEMARIRKAD